MSRSPTPTSISLSNDLLVGKSEADMIQTPDGGSLHKEVVPAWNELKALAEKNGILLKMTSGFRSFDRQLLIWNQKCRGERELLNQSGETVDVKTLTPEQTVFHILRWSALPGASRHHWGTDLDAYDGNITRQGYKLRLTPGEAAKGGEFYAFNQWLTSAIAKVGFTRPYEKDRGGVSPEWWHLSFMKLAAPCFKAHTLDLLRDTLQSADMIHKDIVLQHLDEIYTRFVTNIS